MKFKLVSWITLMHINLMLVSNISPMNYIYCHPCVTEYVHWILDSFTFITFIINKETSSSKYVNTLKNIEVST